MLLIKVKKALIKPKWNCYLRKYCDFVFVNKGNIRNHTTSQNTQTLNGQVIKPKQNLKAKKSPSSLEKD